MINFNIPYSVRDLHLDFNKISGDGVYTKKCSDQLELMTQSKKVLLTTSCTDALEMSAILSDIKQGDEVIVPSFTFVSTVNAFVLRGAKIVFVDIRPDTMNIDENLIESAITPKTKVIIPVHYAGVSAEMNKIMDIAKKYDLLVVEDAAQGVMSTYYDKPLGSIGHLGTYSFHETKNYTMGEGGALLINDEKFIDRAEIIREKGTNRSQFFRGYVDKYTWVDIGSSFLPSDLNAAYLYPQLVNAEEINEDRLNSWNSYYNELKDLAEENLIKLPTIPSHCKHNGHMFYIKLKDLEKRTELMDYLKEKNIMSVFHYVPLHSSPAGMKHGRFHGQDKYTTKESERLLRLPMYYGLKLEDIRYVSRMIHNFFEQ